MTPRALFDLFLSHLFEPPCAACGAVLARPLSGAVCEACWAAIASLPMPNGERVRGVDGLIAVGAYEGRLREVVHALKYDGRRSIAPPLAMLMRARAAPLLADADLVVPVPLHPRRERARGFNQAALLARGLGPPVVPLLARVAFTRPQVDLPADERRRNVVSAFSVPARRQAEVARVRTVVLVDDVVTTGATIESCALALREAGARHVRAIAAARVPGAAQR